MAKPTGPLLSLGASGTLADTLVYSKWKGRPYVRRYVIPANPDTAEQQLTRNTFGWCSGVWKNAGSLTRAAWDLLATGQVLTGRNAFMGRNTNLLRSEIILTNFLASNGAKGGLAPSSIVVTFAVATQALIVFTNPTAPTNWTLAATIGMAIEDQNPQSAVLFAQVEAEDAVTQSDITLTGLITGRSYSVSGWLRWTKPDGTVAYGPSLSDIGAAT